MEQEKDNDKLGFDITSLDTYVLLTLFVNILGSKAWQHLGLRAKPGTDQVEKDLDRARTIIDCMAFLIDKLEPHLKENENKSLKNLLTDLQINYARVENN